MIKTSRQLKDYASDLSWSEAVLSVRKLTREG